MKENYLNKIEGIGLLLILFSFFIQIEENSIQNSINEVQFYQTQEKLDEIWNMLGKLYKQDSTIDVNKRYEELIEIEKNWKIYSENKKEIDKWKEDVWFSKISSFRIWIFILGALLVAFPKFINKNENTNHK